MDRGAEAQAATDPSLAQTVVEEACEDAKSAEVTAAPEADVVDEVDASPRKRLRSSRSDGTPAAWGVAEAVGRPLSEALLSVGWTFPADHAVSQGQPDYLDGSCLIYAEERLLDVVDFRGAHSAAVGCHSQKASSATYEWSAGRGKGAGVLHSGDVMSAEGGTHVIRVRLADLPACATDCFFAISAYNCRNLSLFRSLNVRLLDADCPTQPLAKLSIQDVPPRASAVIVCSLGRRFDSWTVRCLHRACDATVRDYTPMEAAVNPFQEGHVRWRRRRPLMLVASLWQAGRALPIEREGEDACEEACDLIMPLLKLPAILFQCVVQFI